MLDGKLIAKIDNDPAYDALKLFLARIGAKLQRGAHLRSEPKNRSWDIFVYEAKGKTFSVYFTPDAPYWQIMLPVPNAAIDLHALQYAERFFV